MWDDLLPGQQALLAQGAFFREVAGGELLHGGSKRCTGLLAVVSGQLRSYILSDEGREITIYRLFERDICLLSAACMLSSIRFDVTVEAEKPSRLWVIPAESYQQVMRASAPLANYTNGLIADRFSEVMWLVEQILWRSQDKRLAAFLLEESAIEGSPVLRTTHDRIANHLGTAREVVTRMLRYLQGEGMVRLSRGSIELTNPKALAGLAQK